MSIVRVKFVRSIYVNYFTGLVMLLNVIYGNPTSRPYLNVIYGNPTSRPYLI